MKYLRLYEAFHSGGKGYSNPKDLIDWEFISDIKDMALEYLDYGKFLSISVESWCNAFYMNGKLIGSISFSHDIDEVKLHGENLVTEYVNDIRYYVKLLNIPNNTRITNGLVRLLKEETAELLSRIEEAYPDKKLGELAYL